MFKKWLCIVLVFCLFPFAGAELYGDSAVPALEPSTFHFTLSASSMQNEWGQIKSSYAGGLLTVERRPLSETITEEGAVFTTALPNGQVSVSDYPYLVFKAKNSDISGVTQLSVYWSNQTTDYSEANRITTNSCTYGGYTYFYIQWCQKLSTRTANGFYRQFMYLPIQLGYVRFCDIFLSSAHPLSFLLDTMTLGESQKISEDGGSVTLTPRVRTETGEWMPVGSYVHWRTDTIHAILQPDENGNAVLTGKTNGTVTVTAELINDPSYTASVTCTVTGQVHKVSKKKLKIVNYGNSICFHGMHPGLGWYGNWGMAASSQDKDYVHLLLSKLKQKYGEENVEQLFGQGQSNFETAISGLPDDYDYSAMLSGLTAFAVQEKPDIVTIQYADNSGEVDVYKFQRAMSQFVAMLKKGHPDMIVVILSPHDGDADRFAGTRLAAEEWDAPFVDIMQYETPEYEAIGQYEHVGVAAHPSDKGMAAIADEVYLRLSPVLTEKIDPTIEFTPCPLEIVWGECGDSIHTDGGTLSLHASVFPQDGAQDLIWSSSNKRIATVNRYGVVKAINNGEVTITATSSYDSSVFVQKTIYITGQSPHFTVTYDPNTTDLVTGMPEPDSYAKGKFVFDTAIPSRSTYRFEGWALAPDGEPTDSVLVDSDKTVYAVWETARRFCFDRDGDAEGFTVLNGFNQYVMNGYYQMIATGTDEASGNILTIHSPKLNLVASEYQHLMICMRNTEKNANTTLTLTIHTTAGDREFLHPVLHTDYIYYVFDLTGTSGTITGFTLKPTDRDTTVFLDSVAFLHDANDYLLRYDANTADTVTDMPGVAYTAEGDYVLIPEEIPQRTGYRFLGWSTAPDSKLLAEDRVNFKKSPVLYAVWDKNDHWEMDRLSDYTLYNMSATIENGILSYNGIDDPMIIPVARPIFPVSSASGTLNIKMRWLGEQDAKPRVYFGTEESYDLSEAQSAGIDNVFSKDGWQVLSWDLASCPFYTGTLAMFRFDPSCTSGECEVDYIRYADSAPIVLVEKGKTYTITSDPDASYIVKKGGTIAPAGRVVLKSAAVSGDVDDANGYIVIKDTCELGENARAYRFCPSDYPVLAEKDFLQLPNGTKINAPFDETYLLGMSTTENDVVLFGNEDTVTGGLKLSTEGAASPLSFVYRTNEDNMSVCYVADLSGKQDAVCIICVYDDDGRLVDVHTENKSGGAVHQSFVSFDNVPSGNVLFFLWKDTKTLLPSEVPKVLPTQN